MAGGKSALKDYLDLLDWFKKPLPTEPNELIAELSKRVLRVLPYMILSTVASADDTLKITIEDPHANAFQVFENDEKVLHFQMLLAAPGYRSLLTPGKEEVVIKALRIVMCHAMNNKRGLHLYSPPYPAPEMMFIEIAQVVKGIQCPRRFISRAWLNWMLDSAKNPRHLITAALKLIGMKLFPEGLGSRKLQMKDPKDPTNLEFEILEFKNI